MDPRRYGAWYVTVECADATYDVAEVYVEACIRDEAVGKAIQAMEDFELDVGSVRQARRYEGESRGVFL